MIIYFVQGERGGAPDARARAGYQGDI